MVDLSLKMERERSKQKEEIEHTCGKLAGELQQAWLTEAVKMALVKK